MIRDERDDQERCIGWKEVHDTRGWHNHDTVGAGHSAFIAHSTPFSRANISHTDSFPALTSPNLLLSFPHHPTHHRPNPPHRLNSIARIQQIEPFRTLHTQLPPLFPLLAWIATARNVLNIPRMHLRMHDRQMVIHARNKIYLCPL